MSDTSQGEGWWIASDGKWYAPEQHPDYVAPVKPSAAMPAGAAETVALPQPDLGTPPPTATPGPAFAPAGAPTETFEGQLLADPDYNLPATDAPSSSKRSLILGLGAIVLIAGLGFLAFRFFGGSSAAGGADSPEAAIDQLVASINERDAVGFVDVFDPDEIDAWFGSFAPAFAEFETVSDSGDVSNEMRDAYASVFNSFDYTLTGPDGEAVTYEVEPLDDNGRITRVRVQGLDFELMVEDTNTAVIGAFGDEPTAIDVTAADGITAEFRDEGNGLATRIFVPFDGSSVNEFAEGHIDLVTVQKDGKWFVSIGYTMLELARGQGEFDAYPNPDFGRAFALVDDRTGGSESPESVVQEMFTSIESLDYETIIELTDPLATPYLHDYQPLIDSQVNEQDRRDAVADARLRFEEVELTRSEWEGRTVMTFDNLNARVADGSLMLDTANWCLTFDDGFESDRVCAEDGISELLSEADSNTDPRDLIPDETGIVVIERNGRWYLDPLGTMGYYTDQLAEIGTEVIEDLNDNSTADLAGLGEFFVVEGPIARQGQPAVAEPGIGTVGTGAVGVALDLSGYPTVEGDFSDFNVAVARVVNDEPGTFVTYSEVPLMGESWVVVYDTPDDDPEYPAIAANSDGELDVELFEATVTEIGSDGFSGQLGGQGRPQVFTFGPDVPVGDIEIQGATAQTVFDWEPKGVVFDDPNRSSSVVSDGAFIVVFGEPGASYTVTVNDPSFAEPEPETDPDPVPEPDPFVDNAALNEAFADLVEPQGFAYSNEQQGGYFDGCGGPDDPDVTSYVYEETGGALMILTSYPSFDRSVNAFDQLINVASPCVAFDSIEVNDVVLIDIDNIRIEWQLIDDPSSIVFEHYRLVGNTVVVATDDTVADLDEQLAILDNWTG